MKDISGLHVTEVPPSLVQWYQAGWRERWKDQLLFHVAGFQVQVRRQSFGYWILCLLHHWHLFRFASCHVVSALSHFYVESFWVFLLSPVPFLLVGSVRPSFGNSIQSHIQINPRKTQVQILRPHINPHPLRDFAMMMMDLVSTLLLGGTPGGTPFSLTEMCGQSWARCQQLQFCPRHAVASWTYTLPALRNPHRTSASGGVRLWFGF